MEQTFKVQGMSCKGCVNKIEEKINQLEGVSSVTIDFDHEEIQVVFDKQTINLEQIKEKIEEQGYQIA